MLQHPMRIPMCGEKKILAQHVIDVTVVLLLLGKRVAYYPLTVPTS
jgi:hypothetical protein